MRLFGKPGGTRAQLRAALLTVPFDLGLTVVAPPPPDLTFAAPRLGKTFTAPRLGKTFTAPRLGKTFTAGSR